MCNECPACVVEWEVKIQNRFTKKFKIYLVYEVVETSFYIILKDKSRTIKKFSKFIYKCID